MPSSNNVVIHLACYSMDEPGYLVRWRGGYVCEWSSMSRWRVKIISFLLEELMSKTFLRKSEQRQLFNRSSSGYTRAGVQTIQTISFFLEELMSQGLLEQRLLLAAHCLLSTPWIRISLLFNWVREQPQLVFKQTISFFLEELMSQGLLEQRQLLVNSTGHLIAFNWAASATRELTMRGYSLLEC